MTDMFVLLQLPNAGDDLQAIKKGVMELADLVVINKADIDKDAATRAQAQITSALRLFGHHGNPAHAHACMRPTPSRARPSRSALWLPKVIQLSALAGTGIEPSGTRCCSSRRCRAANGRLRRAAKSRRSPGCGNASTPA